MAACLDIATSAAETAPCLEDDVRAEVEQQEQHRPRLSAGRVAAVAAALLGAASAAAALLASRRPSAGDSVAADAAEEKFASKGYYDDVLVTGPRDVQDFVVGSIPKYADPAAHMGSPPLPLPKDPKVKCAESDFACGSSCCSHGSICCNAHKGLCCAPHTMCCYGNSDTSMCCANGFSCGRTRSYGDGLRYDILKQCGGGAFFRRLSDRMAYRSEVRRIAEDEAQWQRLQEEQA